MKELLYEIKQWIIEKIMLFMMDGEIIQKAIKEHQKEIQSIHANTLQNLKKIDHNYNQLSDRLKKIEHLYEMAVELNNPSYSKSGSWAVIVLDGKPEYVRFIRLPRKDIMDIARFLRQFDVGRRPTIDGGPSLPKDFFYHDMDRGPDGNRIY